MSSIPEEILVGIERLLKQECTDLDLKIHTRWFEEIRKGIVADLTDVRSIPFVKLKPFLAFKVAEYLLRVLSEQREQVVRLRTMRAEFNEKISLAATEKEKQDQTLIFSSKLGSRNKALKADRKAFKRWFDHGAVAQRCENRIALTEYYIVFVLNRLAGVVTITLDAKEDRRSPESLWRRLDLTKHITPLLAHPGDSRVRVAAFKCIASAIAVLPWNIRKNMIQDSILAYFFRSALEVGQNTWIQCEALELLALISPDSLKQALERRLENPEKGDDIFVRRRAVGIISKMLEELPELEGLIGTVFSDPSPFVRQALAGPAAILAEKVDNDEKAEKSWLFRLATKDKSPQVRAAALLELGNFLRMPKKTQIWSPLLSKIMKDETDRFVVRVAMEIVQKTVESPDIQNTLKIVSDSIVPVLEHIHSNASDLILRRLAAITLEILWVSFDPEASSLKKSLEEIVDEIKPGKSKRVPKHLIRGIDKENIGRILSVLAAKGYGLCLFRSFLGIKIMKGDHIGFRLWRLLHEVRNPSSDKRQGHTHVVGRVCKGLVRAPSTIMSELTKTKVPGEPLHMQSEGGWRPYLPLPDEILSSLNRFFGKGIIEIYTPEGVTEVKPPKSSIRRIAAAIQLSLKFASYARLRNWEGETETRSDTYVKALAKLGVYIKYRPFKGKNAGTSQDPMVSRFFSVTLPMTGYNLWARFSEYFVSAYENSLYELVWFVSFIICLIAGNWIRAGLAIKKARKRLDLVVGGWGTRGKSGTERLKAALFEALGHGFVSKTTGCEAMFLYMPHFSKTWEIALFRPYEKATIWEHHNLMIMAEKLGSSVFLWECMALQPAFVTILQHMWSRDDYSTITNTYPDHEDIQGPAGYNIPEIMALFIPYRGILITSEEEMRPVLAEAASTKGTRFRAIGWLEAELLTDDILSRFPYEEHPYNIALVLDLAKTLGVDPDMAVKEMADRVVPDIGVLKTFPEAEVNNRRFQFVNGMSANERFGTLSNWQRTGFNVHDLEKDAGIMTSTLVNNRADRVSRSIMFAGIVTTDICTDRCFLIGSNISGLTGYINTAWEDHVKDLSLFVDSESNIERGPVEIFLSHVERLRVPTKFSLVVLRLHVILRRLGLEPESFPDELCKNRNSLEQFLGEGPLEEHASDIASHIGEYYSMYHEVEEFRTRIDSSSVGDKDDLDYSFRSLLTKWFMKKIVVIEDYHATGNQVMHRIIQETPPGMLNRIMGLQNIKGTGLDFVYRWQAYEKCFKACRKLLSEDPNLSIQGLSELTAFREYGLLTKDLVNNTLEKIKTKKVSQSEKFQAGIALVESNMASVMELVEKELLDKNKEGKVAAFLNIIEAVLDAGDAVKRRKLANRVYKDLISERISHERAAMVLADLNMRQKGGWFRSVLGR